MPRSGELTPSGPQTAEQLRARAAHVRELARAFVGDCAYDRMSEFAGELEARAAEKPVTRDRVGKRTPAEAGGGAGGGEGGLVRGRSESAVQTAEGPLALATIGSAAAYAGLGRRSPSRRRCRDGGGERQLTDSPRPPLQVPMASGPGSSGVGRADTPRVYVSALVAALLHMCPSFALSAAATPSHSEDRGTPLRCGRSR